MSDITISVTESPITVATTSSTVSVTVYDGPRTASWFETADTCVAAYVPKGAASLAASYTNLKNPGTYDLTATVAPTFDTLTGWTFNGSTQYLKTGITSPATTLIRFTDGSGPGGGIFGMYTTQGYYYTIVPNSGGSIAYLYGDIQTGSAAPTSGILGLSDKGYFNGVADSARLTHLYTSSNDLWIGGINFNNALLLPYGCKVQAVSIYSSILSATQIATIYTAMAAL
jgi:hypothetical protein